MYSNTPFKRLLPPKATNLFRSDFTKIVKYYLHVIVPLKRGHPSFKATFSLQKGGGGGGGGGAIKGGLL